MTVCVRLSQTSQESEVLMMVITLFMSMISGMTYLFCHLSTLLVDLCMSRLTPLLTQTGKVLKEHVVPGQINDRIHLVMEKI